MKNDDQVFGSQGEAFAMKYLKKQKYKLLDCNYKSQNGEIDIIAFKNGVYVFVEVKTRSTDFLLPQEAVDKHKQENIFATAKNFLKEYCFFDVNYRFDIIEVFGSTPKNFEINHIENAFY